MRVTCDQCGYSSSFAFKAGDRCGNGCPGVYREVPDRSVIPSFPNYSIVLTTADSIPRNTRWLVTQAVERVDLDKLRAELASAREQLARLREATQAAEQTICYVKAFVKRCSDGADVANDNCDTEISLRKIAWLCKGS